MAGRQARTQAATGTADRYRRPNLKTPSFGAAYCIDHETSSLFFFQRMGINTMVRGERGAYCIVYICGVKIHPQARLTMTGSYHLFFIRVCATHTRGPAHSDKEICTLKRVFIVLRILCPGVFFFQQKTCKVMRVSDHDLIHRSFDD